MVRGSLRNVPLGDVFQIVANGQKSGVLTVDGGAHRARIYFDGGRVRVAHLTPGVHLGEILVRMERLSVLEVQSLLAEQAREDAGTPLGIAALYAELITPEELHAALGRQAVEVIAELLADRRGDFEFTDRAVDASQVPTEDAHDAMALLMEAASLRAEVDAGVADPDTLYRQAGDPTAADLPAGAWELLGLIDGRRSARSVAADADLSEPRAYRLLADLEARGVLAAQPFPDADPAALVVSPSVAMRRILRLVLHRTGVRAILPGDTDGDAERALLEAHPRLVVVDDRHGEGWDFVRTLRRTRGRSHLPALVVCDDPVGGPLARWRRPRATTLARPFDEAALQQAVGRLLGRPAARGRA